VANNAAAFAALDEQIRRLRAVQGLAKDAAPEVADELKKELDAQIDRGQGPDGKPWAKRDDGRRPLRNAAGAVTVKAVGTVIVARVTGHHAYHHRGQTRGNVARPIIPTNRLTEPFTRAIKKVLDRRFAETMGAR
jgi:hypothetical protein